MTDRFDVEFLPKAVEFMNGLDKKTQEKIYFDIRKSRVENDPELLNKLTETIWKFRMKYNKTYLRLFSVWDKGENTGQWF